jgi:signal peptidase I
VSSETAAQRAAAAQEAADRAEGRGGASPRKPAKKALPLWQEVLLLLVTALALAVVVKTFLVQAFYIPSGSMETTLDKDDRILVQKVTYWGGDVERGDIVVFDDPGDWLAPAESREASNVLQRGLSLIGLYPTGGHLVKRVIGVGGDHVVCCDSQGRIEINGEPIEETYLRDGIKPSLTPFDQEVPEGSLWVMGDNRGDSSDSRAHLGAPGGGFVATEDVVGRVWTVVWPSSRIQVVDGVDEVFEDVPDGGSSPGS